MKQIIILSIIFIATSLFAEKQSFDRYQTILDRQPFGQPPAGFNPQKMASEVSKEDFVDEQDQLTAEQQEIQRAVSFSALNVEGNGQIMVGFSDRSNPKSPKHYYLAVGDTQDGWNVKACDPSEETLTIVKDEVEVVLKLGDQAQTSAPNKGGRSGGMSNMSGRPNFFSKSNQGPMSYKGRRARREMEEAQAKADSEAREKERARQAEERAAREAAEKEALSQERAENRAQLLAIQEELRKTRESNERKNAESEEQ